VSASGGGKESSSSGGGLSVWLQSRRKAKNDAEGRRKIEEAEGEKFRLLFPHNNELLKKQPTNEPSRRRGFRE
jgi:hypothetical protein